MPYDLRLHHPETLPERGCRAECEVRPAGYAPLFLHYEDDAHTYTLKYQYLLGRDILVAPVHEEGRSDWTLYLPEDNWVHAWTGEAFRGGEVTVNAPIGKPPVFLSRR